MGDRRKGISTSSNARKYYRKLAKLRHRVADRRNDFLQKLTTNLARKYKHLKLETLNIQGMMANRKLAFHIQDASFYKFKTLLENKAKAYGGIVESVDMWYPSSKICSQCHHKKTDLGLKERLYVCDNPGCEPICRDLNSAINLKNAPVGKIVARVGSIRRYACGQVVADNLGRSRKITPMVNIG